MSSKKPTPKVESSAPSTAASSAEKRPRPLKEKVDEIMAELVSNLNRNAGNKQK